MEYYDESSPEENDGKVWLSRCQDLGALSLMFSQPMATLQVRYFEDTAQWKYIPHLLGAIIVNTEEPTMWWTSGFFKADMHRVI